MGNFDFEEYRQPWETGPHWELKREFLERYQDHFQVDRLLCLAQAYSNIELLHCSYPLEVMQQIRQLSQPLQGCKRFRQISVEQKNETFKGKRMSSDDETPKKYKFIKFCSSVDPPIMEEKQSNESIPNVAVNIDYSSIAQSSDLKIIQTLASKVQMQLPVKRTSSFNVIQSSVQSLNMQDLFHLNFRHAIETKSSDVSNKKCYCELYIGTTLLSIGDGNNQENAKKKAAEHALKVLSNFESLPTKNIKQVQEEFCKIKTINIDSTSEETKCNQDKIASQKNVLLTKHSEVFQNSSFSKRVQSDLNILKNFAKQLKSSKTKSKFSALALINETVNRLKASDFLVFNIVEDLNSPVHNRTFICDFSVKNIHVSQGKGTSKKRARNQAAEIGLYYLLKLLEQNKNDCSYSDRDKIEKTIIEETVKDKSQINNSNTSCVEKLTFMKSESNSVISKIDNEINISVETNYLNNNVLPSFNIVTEADDGKQYKNASEELSVKPFIINEKLLAGSHEQQFVLFDSSLVSKVNHVTPGSVLSFSAQQCRKQLSFNIEEIQPLGTVKADLILNKSIIATGIGSNKLEAKQEATQSALEKLRKEVYTLKIKTRDEEGFIISRESMLDSSNHISSSVSEDNLGCKMLKRMGWTGGGIGKTEGIIEPIMANDHSFGRGLGYSDKHGKINSKEFYHKINALLLEYSQTKETQPLIFSSDFCKAERKKIHMIARKYNNLTSNSYGKDEKRQLHIKRKLLVTELLNSVLQAGGSTYKYELVDLST